MWLNAEDCQTTDQWDDPEINSHSHSDLVFDTCQKQTLEKKLPFNMWN